MPVHNLHANAGNGALNRTRFWMVYGDDCGRPTHRHPTRESAHEEAKRLASLNPDTAYFVLKSTKGYLGLIHLSEVAMVERDPDFDEVGA